MTRYPDFFVIGAMKCGTSSLHEQLARRSGLFMSEPKEPNYFSDDARVETGCDEYLALFADALPDQLCGESSTHYTKLPTYPNTVANLVGSVPSAKFIYIVRDPIERMESQYVHDWTQRDVRVPFASAVRKFDRYVAYSSYARQLEPYLEHFGEDRVLLVFFERMVEEPDAELARVCAFLGDPSPEPVHWDDEVGPRNVSSERLRRSWLRETVLKVSTLRALKDRLPDGLRERIKDRWRMQRRPQLDPETRAWVTAQLDLDLAQLGRWLGRELDCENFKRQAVSRQADWSEPAPRKSTERLLGGGGTA